MRWLLVLGLLVSVSCAHAATYKDLVYATRNAQGDVWSASTPSMDKSLRLDLYTPDHAAAASPIFLWIHGGGWYTGDKSDCPVKGLTQLGYAVVSVNYRLSGCAPFPAQLDDCRAAITWLKKHATDYNLNPNRIAVGGFSAGGHLAALIGVTDPTLIAVVDGFGPSDFLVMEAQQPDADSKPRKAVAQLLGGAASANPELAKQASPMTFVGAFPGTPAFLILHAVHDETVPVQQSLAFAQALQKAGYPVVLKVSPVGGHGPQPAYPQEIKSFLAQYFAP